ncbi:hypothetical protein GCM10023238_18620 [Streptomyces heliomycini]
MDGPVRVAAPGPKGVGGSGPGGTAVCASCGTTAGTNDRRCTPWPARDLASGERTLGRTLANGSFGEEPHHEGIDVPAP